MVDTPATARPVISLDGIWHFSFEGATARLSGENHQIRVPGIWQTQFPELRNTQGTGRYRRQLSVPADWSGKDIFLVMEGVFHQATIRIDGKAIATHDNGWTEASIDLTPHVKAGQGFELGIDAHVPDDRDYARGGFTQTLAGKQDWYGVHGGVWKPVRLEARDRLHFAQAVIFTATDLKSHVVSVKGALSHAATATVRIDLSRNVGTVATRDFPLAGTAVDLKLPIPAVDLWSPDDPNLYVVTVSLLSGNAIADAVNCVAGFRRFEARAGQLFLNGQPFYMFGALDQDWYPQEDCRHPSPEFLEQRFRHAKAMGLNTLRCHVKIPDKLYFELADRLGLMVWLDMPYTEFLAPRTREALTDTFRATVATHAYHPSICIWTLFNEGWGIDQDDNADDRRWLIEAFDAAKALVPNSLVVDNSPCFPRNYHLKTDIDDFHWYNGFPHQNDQFSKLTQEFAARAAWTWSPHGDAVKTGTAPLICSEFGVWGLPHPRDIMERDGSEPWWFESGHDWNSGCGYPHGIETRFRDAQLAPLFGDLDGFVDAAQEFQYRALKFQIETLRWAQPIAGYVITELNDVQWESNGLMDVRNNPRRFAGHLANLQTPYLVIGRPQRTSIAVGEQIAVPVRLASAGAAPAGATLTWSFGGQSGTIPLSDRLTTLSITGAKGSGIRTENLQLAAHDTTGKLLSRNSVEFCVVPSLSGDIPALYPADAGARDVLAALSWHHEAQSAKQADVILATRLTTPVREFLLAGHKVLLIANSPDALIDPGRALPHPDLSNFPKMDLRQRDKTAWDGRWMGAFSWRRTDGAWAALPNGAMLDEHWSGLIPNHILTGFRASAFGGLVDAGMAVAWLHKAVAFNKRSFLGKGWLTVTTFELTPKPGSHNPLAPHLLLAMARS